MIKVVELDYLNANKDEAIATITDGSFSCFAYCSQCSLMVDTEVLRPLYALMAENIFIADDEIDFYQSKEILEGKIIAEIVDLKRKIVQIGMIQIEVDGDFPGDVKNGDRVEFAYTRLDLNQR